MSTRRTSRDIHENLGRLLVDTGRSREAEAACRQSIAILESLLTHCPGDRDQRNKLARAQATLARVVHADKPAEAEALFRAAINTHTALMADDPKNVTYRASTGRQPQQSGHCRSSNSVVRWRQRPVTD